MPLHIDYNPSQGRVSQTDAYLTYTPPPPLSHWVQSFWQLNVADGEHCYRSVPDNSVDWIINVDRPEDNFLVTPFLSSIVFDLQGPVSYFGVRFRLLGQQGLTPVALGEWGAPGHSVRASEMLPAGLPDAAVGCLGDHLDFGERCESLARLLLGVVREPRIDSRLVRFINYCRRNIASSIDLSDQRCGEFGVSARQLRRLCRLYLGLSPRNFARVLRFQCSLGAMVDGGYSGACPDHYYDQPHFVREFKRLSGLAPREFMNLSVLYNKTRH